MNHIDDMDQLRESIGLQSYAQKDPVVQYKFLGYDMFEEMTKNIRHDTVGALMHVQIEQKVERKQVAREQVQTRMSLWKEDLTAEKKQKSDVMHHVHAAAERKIKTAAEDLQISVCLERHF